MSVLIAGRQGVEDTQIRPVLPWRERIKIAEGAAKGLNYLRGNLPSFCHVNITSSNIWVFDDYTAKIHYPDQHSVPIKGGHAILREPE